MAYILQVDFPYSGPWGEEMKEAMIALANSISNAKGLIWKIWTVNQEKNEAGGIYLFSDNENASRYLEMHTERLLKFGIKLVNGKIFKVHDSLSLINQAPI
ncbi:monooxygenase [Acinetobacter guillouiae]|uniref:monooxygenase n=1 Tax=Acinetobacter guillouiae TaxID=106649 RepID=UPI00300A23C0